MPSDDALKTRGPWEVRRKVRVPGMTQPAAAAAVERLLSTIPGVHAVVADCTRQTAWLRYETTATDYGAIRETLQAAGFSVEETRWARWKAGWYRDLDLTGRQNARAKPAACCNRPPAMRR